MLKKNVMEQAAESADNELKEAKKRKKRVKKFIEDYEDEINRITGGTTNLLEWLIAVNIDTSSTSLDISYAGDKLVMQGIFKAFRKLGYVSTKRPDANESAFTCYWSHTDSDMRIWLRFSSTVCKRVKIGTKMEEVDVYETRCG
jgi:hypothetical protein